MQEIVSTITSAGQITLPQEVRRALGVEVNDQVAFVIDDAGLVRLEAPAHQVIESIRGAAGKLGREMTWSEMLEVAYEDRMATKQVETSE